VVAWGLSPAGPTPSGVIAIAAGNLDSLVLKSDGTVVAWGNNSYGQTSVPAALQSPATAHVSAIAAGDLHSLALKSDGTVVAWGYNGSGETNVPAGLSGVTAIAAGWYHNLALEPAAATHLTVVTVNPYVAGAAHSVTVTAKDAYGNTATGYRGTIHFTSSDPAAVLPAIYTFTGGDAGVHKFPFALTLKTAGTQWVRATDTFSATITGVQSGIVVS
jgi:alpha-tubulin suppressor-like RCC1 family protein